jgi:hypothetical protein
VPQVSLLRPGIPATDPQWKLRPPLGHPERTRISYFTALTGATYVVLPKENHMQLTEAATVDSKSGGADCLNCQATGAARLEVEAEDSVPLCPPGRVPHVCVGVAGALHGLNKMGRSPFRCCLFRAAKSEREDPPTAGFQAPDKAVILSEALRSSIANRSRRACAERSRGICSFTPPATKGMGYPVSLTMMKSLQSFISRAVTHRC